MAADVKVEYINEGFKEIINSDELGNVCFNAARKIASTANRKHKKVYSAQRWHSNMKGGRVAALVSDTGSKGEGDRLEATEKTLSKAVSQCRIS